MMARKTISIGIFLFLCTLICTAGYWVYNVLDLMSVV
jgi:hypothetical protein